MTVAMKRLALFLTLVVSRIYAFPVAQSSPPTLQADAHSDEPPLVPFQLGANPVPFGPKPSGCSKFELIVARGMSELGDYGMIVGDPLLALVIPAVPDARGYAVQYPADESPLAITIGSTDILQRLTAQDKACPDQKFAFVGFDLGALVIREAAQNITTSIQSKTISVVMFGDPGIKPGIRREPIPEFAPAFKAKLFENCVIGDPVCAEGMPWDSGMGKHLAYSMVGTSFLSDSANFIIKAYQGTPLPPQETAPRPDQEV
ncbi:F-box protein pof12 [Venturia nashicola]|uniref:F-box protein pof12 n=1 Tax=Venturia nashicola TaxID=86259 RepID=A0A4Z1PDG5_9PEZI|nr:F-box protein pof12 [Venturia nashicola]